MDNSSLARHYLDDALASFRDYKRLAEKAFAQLADEELFYAPDAESNSVAVIIKHMSGNMRSRWTDFLTSDGEKPDRRRDAEFVVTPETTRDELLARWEDGWSCVFGALEPLRPEDFDRKVTIRGEDHSIVEAVNRQLAHYAYHVGQIVFLAKHIKSAGWQSLSIPRDRSAEYNAYLAERANRVDETVRQSRSRAPSEFAGGTESEKS